MRNKKLYGATALCLWTVCIVFVAIICIVINSNVAFAEESTINIAESNSVFSTTQDRDYLEVFSNSGEIENVDKIQTYDTLTLLYFLSGYKLLNLKPASSVSGLC